MQVVVRTTSGEAEVAVAGRGAGVTLGELAAIVRGRPTTTILVDGRPVAATTPLATATLRRGSVIELDPPRPHPPSGPPTVELVTIAGVGVGGRRALGPGRYVIGPGRGAHELAHGVVDEVRWRLTVPPVAVTRTQVVELDDRVVELRPTRRPSAGGHRSPPPGPVTVEGTVAFNRPPRPGAAQEEEPIAVPDATGGHDDGRTFPVLAMVAPLPIALTMAMTLGSWRYALFGLLSPIMVVAHAVEERRARRRDRRRASRTDRVAVARVTAEIAHRHREAVAGARRAHPHLAELLSWIDDAHPRLWERRPDDPDAFVVPIGRGDAPWRPPLRRGAHAVDVGAALRAHRLLPDVPITIDLRCGRGAGLVGAPAATRSAARAVVLSAVALHGPADLRVVVCTERGAAREWEWVKWLPHARGEPVPVVTDPAPGLDLLAADASSPRDPRSPSGPVTLVVADGPVWWRGRDAPLRSVVTRPDVRLVALVEHDELVPAVCGTVIELGGGGRATVRHLPSASTAVAVAVDRIELALALAAARRLARLDDPERPAATTDQGPSTVRLLDELALRPPCAEAVGRRWADPDRRPATTLGFGAGPVTVDLVDDGPHALVAGTTGAGKSELLRSLVAGLAATLPPTELNVVLVDFKGGAAFDACARLPHTVGLVTDLDEHLTARMLRSLRAEVTHREVRLRQAGVGSLAELTARDGPGSMPRLLIVVDEFAAMAGRLPELVSGLVDIAQRGRSLGVHLVLATQRPAGVVDHTIRANTNLRIALRVQDDADSYDVIGTRDAATIPRHQPGRAFVRIDAGELIEMRTALATAPSPDDDRSPLRVTPFVVARSRSATERRLAHLAAPEPARGGPTDLDRLVEAIVAAAGPVTTRRPCLDPLPALARVEHLPAHAERDGPGVPLALVDRPDEQRWSVRTWRPGPGGSLGLLGATGSGTTSTLLALAVGIAASTAPDATHLYAIDADTGRLAVLARLPHVGAVVGLADPARVVRVVRWLGGEIDRRRAAIRSDGTGPPADPAIVVLIDNIAALRQRLEEDRRWRDVWPMLERVARDGGAVGLTMVVTASHERGLPLAITAHLAQRLVLRLPDRSAYAAFGLRPSDVPDLGPGRAVDPATGLEQQLLAPPADLSGAVEAVADRWPVPSRPPHRIGAFPARLLARDVIAAATAAGGGWSLPVGVDQRDGEIASMSLRPGQVLAVVGPPGSGRTSTLRTLLLGHHRLDPTGARYAIGRGPELDDLAVGPSELGDVEGWVAAALGDDRGRLVVVDDADALDGPGLVRLAQHRDRALAVVLAGAPDRLRDPGHWARPLLRTRTGLLLAGAGGEGDLLRVVVPPSGERPRLGHGHLVVDGVLVPVLLADGTGTDRPGPG